jgi:diguanylate cyclase (GGDEF)-like protein
MKANKILLIEDNPELLKRKIEELSGVLTHQIDVVENFTQLKEYIAKNRDEIFIALLDYYLDGAKEGENVKFLVEHNIPTIVYTEEFSKDLYDKLTDKGILEYLIKKPNSDLSYTVRLIQRVYNNQNIKAIIVDGHEKFRNKLASNLKDFGLDSLQSSDATTTLELLKKHDDVQLVIIDLDINGEVQGKELIEEIRENYPSSSLAILGVSPHGYNSQLSIEFLKKGANDFITKPFIKEQLNLRIMQVLELLDTIEEKRIEATVDQLTQLKNRRGLEKEIQGIIQSAYASQSNLSVAMIDIDHFKSVNDTYGHDIGDSVLKFLSQQLQTSFRKHDLIVRNGGEEFCVVLEDLSLEKAIEMFEELRVKIDDTLFKENEIEIDITVSIGLFYGLENSIDSMLKKADEKLYEAKESGRNRLIVNSDYKGK